MLCLRTKGEREIKLGGRGARAMRRELLLCEHFARGDYLHLPLAHGFRAAGTEHALDGILTITIMTDYAKSLYAMSNTPGQQIMQAPNVIGYVQCSESGDILVQEGNEVDVLANVLIYFQQVAGLIGESFGLEDFQEAQIQGKSLTVICIPHEGGSIGVILSSRTRINETVTMIRQALASA